MNDSDDPQMEAIVTCVGQSRNGRTIPELAAALVPAIPERTLQRWVTRLVAQGRLKKRGENRSTRYVVPRPKGAEKRSQEPGVASHADEGARSQDGRSQENEQNGAAPAAPSPRAPAPVAARSQEANAAVPEEGVRSQDGRSHTGEGARSQDGRSQENEQNGAAPAAPTPRAPAPVAARSQEANAAAPAPAAPLSPLQATIADLRAKRATAAAKGSQEILQNAAAPERAAAPNARTAAPAQASGPTFPVTRGVDPRFVPLFARLVPKMVGLATGRNTVEERLLVEGVRYFGDDEATIRYFIQQLIFEMDHLTAENYTAYAINPRDFALFQQYWH